MSKNNLLETPEFYYAITNQLQANCPIELDGKLIEAEDFVPSRTRISDVAYDVRCAEVENITINNKIIKGMELFPGCYFKMKLGFRAFIPENWWLNIAPRSGTFLNDNIQALYGIIDTGFENEFCFVGQFIPNACDLIESGKRWIVPFGKRIAQVVVVPKYSQDIAIVSNQELDRMFKIRNDPRGIGGFGSSGAA